MFNIQLKLLRAEKGITQSLLASELNVAKTTIASYEQGINEPNIEMLKKISAYFNVTIDYLVGKSDCRLIEDQAIHKQLGLTNNSISELDLINEKASYNKKFSNILQNINLLLSDTETLIAISNYMDSYVKNGQYVICSYYISQNGEDLVKEQKATEKRLTNEQFSNIFFAEIQKNLNRLKNKINK